MLAEMLSLPQKGKGDSKVSAPFLRWAGWLTLAFGDGDLEGDQQTFSPKSECLLRRCCEELLFLTV